MKKSLVILSLFCSSVFIKAQTTWATFVLQDSICEGGSINVIANSGTIAVSGYTWDASPSTPFISSPNSSSTSITFYNAGTYTISLAAISGTSISYYTDSIVILPNPTVTITGPTNPICPPPTAIGGLYMTGSGANTYTWLPGSYTGSTYWQTQPSSGTTFTLVGEDNYGCLGDTTYYVQVLPLPNVFANAPPVVCAGVNNCFTAGGDLSIYSWSGPCGFSDNSQNPCASLSLGCGGTFTIGGSDINGCVNETMISISVSACLGINENTSRNNFFKVYPNPFKDQLYVISASSTKDFIVQITDITGRVLTESKNSSAEEAQTLNLSGFAPGVYIVKIKSEDQWSPPQKIIKE